MEEEEEEAALLARPWVAPAAEEEEPVQQTSSASSDGNTAEGTDIDDDPHSKDGFGRLSDEETTFASDSSSLSASLPVPIGSSGADDITAVPQTHLAQIETLSSDNLQSPAESASPTAPKTSCCVENIVVKSMNQIIECVSLKIDDTALSVNDVNVEKDFCKTISSVRKTGTECGEISCSTVNICPPPGDHVAESHSCVNVLLPVPSSSPKSTVISSVIKSATSIPEISLSVPQSGVTLHAVSSEIGSSSSAAVFQENNSETSGLAHVADSNQQAMFEASSKLNVECSTLDESPSSPQEITTVASGTSNIPVVSAAVWNASVSTPLYKPVQPQDYLPINTEDAEEIDTAESDSCDCPAEPKYLSCKDPLNAVCENLKLQLSFEPCCSETNSSDGLVTLPSPQPVKESDELRSSTTSFNSDITQEITCVYNFSSASQVMESTSPKVFVPSYTQDLKNTINNKILLDWDNEDMYVKVNKTIEEDSKQRELDIESFRGLLCPHQLEKEVKTLYYFEEAEDLENNNNEIDDSEAAETTSAPYQFFEGPIGYGGEKENFDNEIVVYDCSLCFTIVGYTKQSFNRHQQKYHWISLECRVCKRKYQQIEGRENHVAPCIQYPCQHCHKTFKHLLEVENHQEQHFSNKLIRCYRCGEEFYLQTSLLQHQSIMGENCSKSHRIVHKLKGELVPTQAGEIPKCYNGCTYIVPNSMLQAHFQDHHAEILQSHEESRKKVKRMKLDHDV